MNKKTFRIALIAAAVLTLTACSSTYKNSTSSSSSAKETVKKTKSETQYPLTVKTYDDKGTELDQVFKKAPEKVITNNLSKRIDVVKKKNKSSDKDLKKALIMCAYNDETFGTYKSALQESMLNQLGYTNVATGTSDLTLENLVSMEPELIIYVTSDRNKAMDKEATDKMEKNAVLENVPAIKNKKIMTISYDELMDYGPSVIDSLEKVNDFVNK